MMYNREDVIAKLRSGVCNITFEKVDGTLRNMRATLLPEYLPEDYRNSAPMLTEEYGNTIAVWDADIGAWRSFRLETLKSISH